MNINRLLNILSEMPESDMGIVLQKLGHNPHCSLTGHIPLTLNNISEKKKEIEKIEHLISLANTHIQKAIEIEPERLE